MKHRLYAVGNDKPGDIANVYVADSDWQAKSYVDGIHNVASKNFVTDEWNAYFKTTLPQSEWSETRANAVFSDDYATAEVVDEANHIVKDYVPNEEIEIVADETVTVPESTKEEPLAADTVIKADDDLVNTIAETAIGETTSVENYIYDVIDEG